MRGDPAAVPCEPAHVGTDVDDRQFFVVRGQFADRHDHGPAGRCRTVHAAADDRRVVDVDDELSLVGLSTTVGDGDVTVSVPFMPAGGE